MTEAYMKPPFVGARYEKDAINPLTGEPTGVHRMTITAVDPGGVFGPVASFRRDDGREGQAWSQTIVANWRAIGNVTPIRAALNKWDA